MHEVQFLPPIPIPVQILSARNKKGDWAASISLAATALEALIDGRNWRERGGKLQLIYSMKSQVESFH